MSSEWPTVTIDDVCELIIDCVNKTAPVVQGPTPYRMIRTTNIRDGRIDLNECRFVNEATFAKWTRRAGLQYGDVLLTREAPIGEVGFVIDQKGLFLGQRVVQYRANAQVLLPRFLLYSFLSPALQHQFGTHEGSGSVVSHIRVGDCFKFKLKLPSLPEQSEIADLLGALDDRIALLRETNATLQDIAQAMFKSWFVDFDPVRAKQQGLPPGGMDEATAALFPDSFEASALGPAPQGWRPSVLGDIVRTIKSQAKPSELRAAIKYVGLEHLPRKSLSLVDWDAADGLESAKAKFSEGDVLFGKLRPYFHKVVVAPFDGVCSTDILVCQSKLRANYGFAVMQLFSAELIAYADRLSNGAKMPRISWNDIAAYPLILPAEPIASAYTDVVSPLLDQMKCNVFRAQTLADLRDTLLPRLISGRLRLPESEQAAP